MNDPLRSPTFLATIVPAEIRFGNGPKGPFTCMPGALVSMRSREGRPRTVMAYGGPDDIVSKLLRTGRPIRLTVRFDGGSVRIVGLPKVGRDGAVDGPHDPHAPLAETASRTLHPLLAACGIEGRQAEAVVAALIHGEYAEEAPMEPDPPFDDAVVGTLGILMIPMMTAGLDDSTALLVSHALSDGPVGEFLRDMATLRTQNAARALVLAD